MSASIVSKTSASKTQGKQENIHPLFAESQFVGDLDYDTVFRTPAVLATRLLDSPQALHWTYAFLFGINTDAATPVGVIPEGLDKPPGGIDDMPMQYACNKGIGQLTAEDIADVREELADLAHRCHYEVKDLADPGFFGLTEASDVNPKYAVMSINDQTYRQVLLKQSRTKAENAIFDFGIAVVMLHEMAHALAVYYMGSRVDDFFETSLVAEHGWELESRLFGMCPFIDPNNLTHFSSWNIWQTYDILDSGYDLSMICRHAWKLPKKQPPGIWLNPEFAVKLVSDKFWEEEYLQQGAISLIPEVVQGLCRTGKVNNTTKGIPQSVRDLFRDNAKSYAERKYGRFANPARKFRHPPHTPEDWLSEVSEDEEEIEVESEWTEGENTDAENYSCDEPSESEAEIQEESEVENERTEGEGMEAESYIPDEPSESEAEQEEDDDDDKTVCGDDYMAGVEEVTSDEDAEMTDYDS